MACCKVPGCRKEATSKWAQVNLCGFHRDVVDGEQMEFYEGNKEEAKKIHDERKLFYQIVGHMPEAWRQKYIYPKRVLELKA